MTRQIFLVSLCLLFALHNYAWADGKVVPPRNYQGSLEEKSQEAIIIFHGSDTVGEATEDLILKITVEGDASEFAWVVPFPNPPKCEKEDAKLFRELFDYVESRNHRGGKTDGKVGSENEGSAPKSQKSVEVISREIVGDFDIAVVKETEEGGLNPWLEKEGFQKLEDSEDVLGFYRKKGYVFACVKVSSEALQKQQSIDSHPLRFSFKTGGRDAIYFPMKMTGLQESPFDVNLYVFYGKWLNDKINKFGYKHRGFDLVYRDWDTKTCESNAGKAYSLPSEDSFLDSSARLFPTVTKLMQKLHPGERYYLTNIRARNLKPDEVRQWSDDLWMFPYYTAASFIPYDVRDKGPASAAWPNENAERASDSDSAHTSDSSSTGLSPTTGMLAMYSVGIIVVALLALLVAGFIMRRPIKARQVASKKPE